MDTKKKIRLAFNQKRTLTEAEKVNDDKMAMADYEEYWPSKMQVGKEHPVPVVETTSLGSVEPCDIYYQLGIPQAPIQSGELSCMQLETITYAAQAHDHVLPDGSRVGFLIGDGEGAGKNRTIAGIIYENWLRGRQKGIWITVSKFVRPDILRDLAVIGATHIYIRELKDFKYEKISSQVFHDCGMIFCTYSSLIEESDDTTGKYSTRFGQLLDWCGQNFDGLIIFDECHKTKNLCPFDSEEPTVIGQAVLDLQGQLPKARVVYASAMGVTDLKNMGFMVRLGLWGYGKHTFCCFNDFYTAMERHGGSAIEIVGMDLKVRGLYIARQLGFEGVSFRIEEMPVTKEFLRIYDQSVQLWVEALQNFKEAAEIVGTKRGLRKIMWGHFWSSHYRFFKYLWLAPKVKRAILMARECIKYGKNVVISLQSTRGIVEDRLVPDDVATIDFVYSAKGVFQSLVERHFPLPSRNMINFMRRIKDDSSSQPESSSTDNNNNSSEVVNKQMGEGTSNGKTKKRSAGGSDRNEEDADDEAEEDDDDNDDKDSDMAIDDNLNLSSSSSDVTNENKKLKLEQETEAAATSSTSSSTITIDAMSAAETSSTNIANRVKSELRRRKNAILSVYTIKHELLRKIELLGSILPSNSIDQIIDELGGTEFVAEMTERRGRFVENDDGSLKYNMRINSRASVDLLNIKEKNAFMLYKNAAIISEPATGGIPLHCDRRMSNKRSRVHITLELPLSVNQAVQQFGRTHRTSQAHCPQYIFIISKLTWEQHLAALVATRLESLGAISHGDRRSTEASDISKVDVDNKYCKQALEVMMHTILGYVTPLVPPPADYSGEFFKDIAGALMGVGIIMKSKVDSGELGVIKDYKNLSKFFKRILGFPLDLQERIFKYFSDTMSAIMHQARRAGNFDHGSVDLVAGEENVTRLRLIRFQRRNATGVAFTDLHTIIVDRGMFFQDALCKYADLYHDYEGFYLSHKSRNHRRSVIMVVLFSNTETSAESSISSSNSSGEDSDNSKKKKEPRNKKEIMCQVYRPNTGLQARLESLYDLEKKYRKVRITEAESHWTEQYNISVNTCSHAYWNVTCRNVTLGNDCEVGMRQRLYHVLAGSVLSIWGRIMKILNTHSNGKVQLIRIQTTDEEIFVGTMIPKSCFEPLMSDLITDSEEKEEYYY
ncbi:protein strawberry notch-like [Drosophila serrata]|uniref:protein strawberry notch-like n=1 Tax=Drosophila serrata TaxID=7274 RepID=UPI000A1D1B0F|nr:protein strawberry notch-like [Drosophila serrata]